GADLSVPGKGGERLRVTQEAVERLEAEGDVANSGLEPLKSFVLPGGGGVGARLFVARAACRPAEGRALPAAGPTPLAGTYLNRLSDLLFILARAANHPGGEMLWKPGGA